MINLLDCPTFNDLAYKSIINPGDPSVVGDIDKDIVTSYSYSLPIIGIIKPTFKPISVTPNPYLSRVNIYISINSDYSTYLLLDGNINMSTTTTSSRSFRVYFYLLVQQTKSFVRSEEVFLISGTCSNYISLRFYECTYKLTSLNAELLDGNFKITN